MSNTFARIRTVAFYIMIAGATLQIAHAAVLRGRLDRIAPNGSRYPAADVVVSVYNPSMGRSSPYRTGGDGMYYLQIPPGSYYLEIWINPTPGAQPLVYQVQVGEPYTDIPPVVVP